MIMSYPPKTNMAVENHHFVVGNDYIFKWLGFDCHVDFLRCIFFPKVISNHTSAIDPFRMTQAPQKNFEVIDLGYLHA